MLKISANMKQRIYDEANYICANNATIRNTAETFLCSKTTVHKDMIYYLPKIDSTLARKVRAVINKNKREGPMRGGLATRQMWKEYKSKKTISAIDQFLNNKRG